MDRIDRFMVRVFIIVALLLGMLALLFPADADAQPAMHPASEFVS